MEQQQQQQRLWPCERALFCRQLQQRQSASPLVSVTEARLARDAAARFFTAEACDVVQRAQAGAATVDVATVGDATCAHHYAQLLVDKVHRRVAPVYVVDVGASGKRRRLVSEVAFVVRCFDVANGEDGGDDGNDDDDDDAAPIMAEPRKRFKFTFVDVDDGEDDDDGGGGGGGGGGSVARQRQSDEVVAQTADRLHAVCASMQTRAASTRLVRFMLAVRALPIVRDERNVVRRRAILVRALIDSPDFACMHFPHDAEERAAGAVVLRWLSPANEGALLDALGMLLELANPKRDLARLFDARRARAHHNGKGATWHMSEAGASMMRPDAPTWSHYVATVGKDGATQAATTTTSSSGCPTQPIK